MDAQREVRQLLDQIRVLTTNPVIQRVSDQIEVLCRAQFAPADLFLPALCLTKSERRILDYLHTRLGKLAFKDAIVDAYSFDFRDSPHTKTLDVLVCRLRPKIKYTGYSIETVHGLGFRLMKTGEPSDPPPSKSQLVAENKLAALAVADRMMAA